MNDAGNGTAKRLDRLEKDMWYGNGKPGLTTRTESLEARVTTLEKYIAEKDNRIFVRMNILIGGFVSLTVALIVWMLRH